MQDLHLLHYPTLLQEEHRLLHRQLVCSEKTFQLTTHDIAVSQMQTLDGPTQGMGGESGAVVEEMCAEREVVAKAEEMGGTRHKE